MAALKHVAEKDLFRILVLVIIAALIGIWSVLQTVAITKDGVYWTECARRLDSIETTSGVAGVSGQNYVFCSELRGGSGMLGNSGMGISVGINGISVYEHDTNYVPALAVYQGDLGTDWNCVTVTYSNKQPRIYLNGILVRTGLVSPKKNVFAPRQLGGRSWGYFEGRVRAVHIWDRALSDGEVLATSMEEAPEEGLVGYWPLKEGRGKRAHDQSGNEYHSAINGAAWTDCREGHALQFDGVDDTVTWDYPAPANHFTVSAWVQTAKTHEIPSMVKKMSRMDDPGLPLMISCWYRLLRCFGLREGELHWAMAGQSLVLVCRLLSLVPLYYLGRLLVGGKHAFWALLILVFLPWPAELGHDVLREWPHLLCLSAGLLFVLLAFTHQRIMLFLPAGLLAGLGHTVRPECAQVVLYAVIGLIVVLVRTVSTLSRRKAVMGAALLVAGFAIVFAPYVHARGRVLPVKLAELLKDKGSAKAPANVPSNTLAPTPSVEYAGFIPEALRGPAKLIQRLSENQYYYFFAFMLIGGYLFWLRPGRHPFDKWLVATFIAFNFLMYTALEHNWGYISRRHALPLTVMTTFFVPLGVETFARLFSAKLNGPARPRTGLFLILTSIGLVICLVKLAEPKGSHVGLRKTAEYLKLNTPTDAIVAVPDSRIGFYADRTRMLYDDQRPEGLWDYIVVSEKRQ